MTPIEFQWRFRWSDVRRRSSSVTFHLVRAVAVLIVGVSLIKSFQQSGISANSVALGAVAVLLFFIPYRFPLTRLWLRTAGPTLRAVFSDEGLLFESDDDTQQVSWKLLVRDGVISELSDAFQIHCTRQTVCIPKRVFPTQHDLESFRELIAMQRQRCGRDTD